MVILRHRVLSKHGNIPFDADDAPLLRNVLGGRDGSKERRRGIQTMRPPFYLPNCLYEADDNQISSED